MPITLEILAAGDVDYIDKHNANYAALAAGHAALEGGGDTFYYIAGYLPTGGTASAVAMCHVLPIGISLPVGLTGSYGHAQTAATGSTTYTIKKNGSSVGSLNFAASGTTATFTFTTATSFSAGDRLEIVAPGTLDTTLAGIAITIKATRA